MASAGATRAASRAGISAEKKATPVPVRSAPAHEAGERAIAPGALVTNNAFTVSEIIPSSPAARNRPIKTPIADPISPSIDASARNTISTPRALVPSARSMPISVRRRTTLTAIVL